MKSKFPDSRTGGKLQRCKFKWKKKKTNSHSPVTRISHEHVESLLQSYPFLLAAKFLTLSIIMVSTIVARSCDYLGGRKSRGWYLPLPQLLLKLEHPLVIVVAVVKRCHAARHSEVKKSKDDRACRFKWLARRGFAYGAIRKTAGPCGADNRDSSNF